MTPHIKAKKDEIAEVVIMPGDPLRAKYIAEKYLDDYELVNNVRMCLMYTGYYNGKRVTIGASGMGMPSMSIYAYELFTVYDVSKIIRVGSCGSYFPEVKVRDIILAEKAYTLSNFAFQFDGEEKNMIKSSFDLNKNIIKCADSKNLKMKIGTINSSDVFYNQYKDKAIKDNFCLGVEMECFALFYLAKKLGKDATAVLTVSDNLVTKEELSSLEREQTFDEAITLVLDSIK